jgi:F-type H+-transporting ATPase subunit gamma
MPNTLTLKRRINSIRSTRQITKAMQLVSASKMRRAQQRAKESRDYREVAYSILARLSSLKEVEQHPLFEKRSRVNAKLYVVITSNSGLAGAYNYNVLKLFTKCIIEDRDKHIKSQVIMIGLRGANHVRHLEHIELLAVYPAFGDKPTPNDIRPILNTILEQYRTKKTDEVHLIYTNFVSNITQQATELSLLPAQLSEDKKKLHYKYNFTNFEPSVEAVLDSVTTRLVEVQIWQSLLESLASEHSMRMIAMKNATDNANDLIKDYTLEFNTARQAGITQEIAEITNGAEALRD